MSGSIGGGWQSRGSPSQMSEKPAGQRSVLGGHNQRRASRLPHPVGEGSLFSQPPCRSGTETSCDDAGRTHTAGPVDLQSRPALPPSSSGWLVRTRPRPCRRRMRRIELVETLMPRPRSSLWMRTQPQLRFSRAIRTMSSTSSSLMGGRPGPRVDRQRRHLRLESSRCQQRSVSGVTRKQRQRRRGSNRLSAASIARSVGR